MKMMTNEKPLPMRSTPDTKLVLVTPEKAREWLATQHTNRPLNRRAVSAMARDITEGRWEVTHQGIAFDFDCHLVDGQHRLRAVIEADAPASMFVTYGVTRNVALYAVDQGGAGARRYNHQIAIRGEKNASTKAAFCRVLNMLTNGAPWAEAGHRADLDEMLEMYRATIERVILETGDRAWPSQCQAVFALALSHPRGDEFMTGCVTGAGLNHGDPRLPFRDYVHNKDNKLRRSKNDAAERILRTVSCLDAFLRNETSGKVPLISLARYERFCDLFTGGRKNQSLVSYAQNLRA